MPFALANLLPLLLVVPLFTKVILRRERLIIDKTLVLMIGFFAVLAAASLFAKDASIALKELARYAVEGLLLYFLVVNVVREWPALRRIVWALLITGGVLGSLSLYQEITHDYTNELGGLSQRILRDTEGNPIPDVDTDRASGPVGEANRYAQILVVLLPLGLFRFWHERSLKMRLLAAAMIAMILAGVVLTYSRGAFVAIAMIVLMIMLLRLVSVWRVAALAAAGALAV